MTERVTVKDVRLALAHYIDTMERYGIAYDGRVGMDAGSQTYGRAWWLYRTDVPREDGTLCTGHYNPPIGSGYLGWSAREAMETLHTMTRTMHDMAQALDLPRYETTLDRVESSLWREAQGDAS